MNCPTCEDDLKCTKCGSIVYVKSNWYGLSVRFRFKCKCNELDILSDASYIETIEEALRRRKEWKQNNKLIYRIYHERTTNKRKQSD